MRPARLRNPDKTIVRLASRTAVQGYFAGRSPTARQTSWLDAGNRYREKATETYGTDFKATPNTVDAAALIEYIAASAPTHSIDGWSYLARSTDAVLRGDLCSALHLGYYAELRAAMSLLACEGIGVFNRRHPVIAKAGVTSIARACVWNGTKYVEQAVGTHAVVWPLLGHWASLERAARLLDALIAPDGHGLRTWLDALGIPRPLRAISKRWFRRWGIDLSMLSEDHEARNMVSYRPSELRLPPTPSASRATDFVSGLWSLFEPSAGGRFPQLERALLRKVIRESGRPVPPAALEAAFTLDADVAASWSSFLSETQDPLPLSLAEQSSDVESPDCALQVISRAALLLFLATGSTRQHLINAGYSGETLEFFWRRQCEARFDGPAASLPDDPIDLWRDIADYLDDAREWLGRAGPGVSLGQWRSAQPEVANKIVGLELAGVWGLVS